MDYWYLTSAALISLVGMLVHGFAGARVYLNNVDQSNLTPLTKSLSWVAWHVFTVFLMVSAVTLLMIAHRPDLQVAAYPVIGVNLLGAILFIALGVTGHRLLLKMPGAYLMGLTAVLAWLGIT